MKLGYTGPLNILPFDHRVSYVESLFGFTSALSVDQVKAVSASKDIIYAGLKRALYKGAPKEGAGVLVDEAYGASILRDARAHGLITCLPVEKSGQEEFAFDYGDGWKAHIDAFDPTFVKVLVRYNPEGDQVANQRQIARLREVSDYCHASNYRLMFELLVPMTSEQSSRLKGDRVLFDRDLRPYLTVDTIRELQDEGIEPDVWKIEGLGNRGDCEAMVLAARRHGRDDVGCIVLGRGSNEAQILDWLRIAAPVPGFVGFAIGRTSFWDALVAWRAGTLDRDAAIEVIADRYLEWVHAFSEGRSAGLHHRVAQEA